MNSLKAAENVRIPVIEINPVSGATPLDVREVWQYRDMILMSITREFHLRYVQSVFGILWGVLNPFLQMVIFSLLFGVFAKMPSAGIPYPIFLFSGMVPWLLFSNALTGAMTSLQGNIGLCSKIYFPRILFPIIKLFSGVPNFGLTLIVLLAMMLFYGLSPTLNILWAPLFLILGFLIVAGVGFALAVLSIHFRDIREIMGHFVQVWYYCTPIVFSREAIPEKWQHLLFLNPMAPVIEGFRWALLGTAMPPIAHIQIAVGMGLVLFFGGIYLFQRLEGTLIDVG